ncbi:MAG TPA: S46 family peptidase [Chitinophagaceae bacterium]|nr:S46 family peptidase [Chitinophagaceae bacterium]MCC6634156.1 S46 family peptidase [Chitinophagaceae bacterium]HNF29279.1 S46 family peptidase [Chitinophagaceae bacterium]HNM35129.1 S46 family peptidase [Chitinophagaceae bacterium]
MKKILLALVLCISILAKADEGMWLPQLLQQLNEGRMKAMGMKISAKDIYDINKSSLKDAIVSFGGFCTGEIISSKGLILTNHHCGFRAIQAHSTIENNIIENGFWAKTHKDELGNKGLYVTFIKNIIDVTNKVLAGVNESMQPNERQAVIDKNIDNINSSTKLGKFEKSFVREFFDGNMYYLFVTETFNDVRLVGAPPNSIGNFGVDTDNWVWPRHTGDFSLFRIYANKNNEPADYSSDNIPYTPKRFLNISMKGIKENDFTMVFGFPGKTNEYLPSEAVRQIAQINDPAKIYVRDKALAVLSKYMRNDMSIKIQYAAKYAGIANAWKKWQGEVLGLTKTNAVEKKLQYEQVYNTKLKANTTLYNKYNGVLDKLINAYKRIEQYGLARDYYNETISKIELFSLANRIIRLKNVQKNGAEKFKNAVDEQIKSLPDFYKDFNAMVDKDMFIAMMDIYLNKMPKEFISNTVMEMYKANGADLNKWADKIYSNCTLVNKEKTLDALNNNAALLIDNTLEDDLVKLMLAIRRHYSEAVAGELVKIQDEIDQLQRQYMKAQMEVMKDKKFYPNANSTLRVTYGKVDGYSPADARVYKFQTYLDGVMEKYKPGDYEFDVNEKLRTLYKNKDYGIYGVKGKMPVCFIASNHTTGGNSGSPALNAYGNLIGLNFDRGWEGTMSDINYDASICRNIMVDIRYILFIIDKYAGAGHLVKEMKLMYDK